MLQEQLFSSIWEKHKELNVVLEKNYTQQEAKEIKQLLASYFAKSL